MEGQGKVPFQTAEDHFLLAMQFTLRPFPGAVRGLQPDPVKEHVRVIRKNINPSRWTIFLLADRAVVIRFHRDVGISLMAHKHALHMIIDCSADPVSVKPDHVRLPVDIMDIAEHWCVAGQSHRRRFLQFRHIGRFRQCVLHAVSPGCVLPEEHFRPVGRVRRIMVHIGQEPFRRLVIVFIHIFQFLSACVLPAHLIGLSIANRARTADQFNLRICFTESLRKPGHVFVKFLMDFLIAHGQIPETEGLRMSHFCPDAAPVRIRAALCKFNQVHSIPDIFFQQFPLCKAKVVRVQSPVDHRQRLTVQILAQKEILIKANAHGLVVTPVVSPARPVFHRTQRPFPVIDPISCIRIQLSVMRQAAARKAQKTRLHLSQGLNQVGPESVLPSLPGIQRHQGREGNLKGSVALCGQKKPRCAVGILRCQQDFMLFPVLPQFNDCTRTAQSGTERDGFFRACPQCQPAGSSFLRRNPLAISEVADAHMHTSLNTHIVGIPWKGCILGSECDFRVSDRSPSGQRGVFRPVHAVKLKVPVLQQFRIQSAVRCMVQIFKKETKQIAKCFSFLFRVHSDLHVLILRSR